MPIIDPVPREDMQEQGLGHVLDSYERMGDPDAVFPRILAHAPGYADALWDAMAEGLYEGGVPHELKELIRIQLAHTAHDPYFADLTSTVATESGLTESRIAGALGDFENDPQFTDAEKWALRYAYLMYRTPELLDAAFYDTGREYWTDAQIVEMGGLIAVHYGMQIFMRTLEK